MYEHQESVDERYCTDDLLHEREANTPEPQTEQNPENQLGNYIDLLHLSLLSAFNSNLVLIFLLYNKKMPFKKSFFDENMGPTKKTRQEWKGRSDEDRKKGATENISSEYSRSGFGQESCVTNDYETWKRDTDNAEAKRKSDAEKQYQRIKKRIQRGENPFSDDVKQWLYDNGYSWNPFVDFASKPKVQGSGWFGHKNEEERFAQEFIDRYPVGTDVNKIYIDAAKEYHPDARPDLDEHDRAFNGRVFASIKNALGK